MYKTDERERRVLKYLEGNGEATVVQIAKAVRSQESAVRYMLRQFFERGMLKRRVFVNTFALGFQRVAIFIALATQNAKQKATFLSALSAHPHVSLLLEVGGEFHLEVNLTVRTSGEIQKFIDWMGSNHGEVIFTKLVTLQLEHRCFGSKFLSTTDFPRQPLFHGDVGSLAQIDSVDETILSAAMDPAWNSHRDLAKVVGLSPPSFEVRWKKLIAAKVITGVSYLIEHIGIRHYVLLIQTKTLSTEAKRRLYAFAAKHPNIYYLVANLGSWDFEFGVDVEDDAHLSILIERLYETMGDVLFQLKVVPLFRRLKVTDYPFIAPGSKSPVLKSRY